MRSDKPRCAFQQNTVASLVRLQGGTHIVEGIPRGDLIGAGQPLADPTSVSDEIDDVLDVATQSHGLGDGDDRNADEAGAVEMLPDPARIGEGEWPGFVSAHLGLIPGLGEYRS